MSELEKALNRYYDKFKHNYPLVITCTLSDDEIIADINNCIEQGKKAPEPRYGEDVEV